MSRDMMPAFELYQPDTVKGAVDLLGKFGKEGWAVAGGNDSLDWFKDRIKRPKYVVDRHRAGAAFAAVAAELRAGETELVAQRHRERLVRQHVDRAHLAVHVELQHSLDAARRALLARTARERKQIPGARYRSARRDHALDELAPRSRS